MFRFVIGSHSLTNGYTIMRTEGKNETKLIIDGEIMNCTMTETAYQKLERNLAFAIKEMKNWSTIHCNEYGTCLLFF